MPQKHKLVQYTQAGDGPKVKGPTEFIGFWIIKATHKNCLLLNGPSVTWMWFLLCALSVVTIWIIHCLLSRKQLLSPGVLPISPHLSPIGLPVSINYIVCGYILEFIILTQHWTKMWKADPWTVTNNLVFSNRKIIQHTVHKSNNVAVVM